LLFIGKRKKKNEGSEEGFEIHLDSRILEDGNLLDTLSCHVLLPVVLAKGFY
jgi:hypothetical protein